MSKQAEPDIASLVEETAKAADDNGYGDPRPLINRLVERTIDACIKSFDMMPWKPEGTLLDPHMIQNSRNGIADSAHRRNADVYWAHMHAKEWLQEHRSEIIASDD